MGSLNKDFSEKNFQEKFVKELEKYRWDAPDYLNGNKQKVTVEDLVLNWRKELNRINADQLEGVELTDNEFKQILERVNNINNSYEAAKLLSIEGSVGKIDAIHRDKNDNVTRNLITLTIFKKAEVRGGDSRYQIAREVSTKNGNRFDIILLINGLPLINIEQKRADKSVTEAFGQFKRYYEDGEYCNNFMAFSQMMVIASEIETKYFATPKSINDFNMSFVFNWADKNNKVINDWKKVIEHFLMIPMAHQMVGDYLVIDESNDIENRRHMLMRPYQVYALQAVEGAAFGWDNKEKMPHGGFVWHTTGSGKTITSFKTALFLSTRAGFDKVVFLLDRRELDNRTSENFKAYAVYESVAVDDTPSTYQLKKKLKSVQNGIVVTTTFKLSSLVKDLLENSDFSLQEKKMIFIVDEAHRTTMGKMMGDIKDYFKKNGLFYGFTGTPLFDENNVKGKINKESELINTTEKLFGPKLHQYTIDEAIADKNVLGFHVDYINTGEFSSYESLRETYGQALKIEKPEMTEEDIERTVYGISELDLEKETKKRGILVYQDETHIPRVVERILSRWNTQSQDKVFNAILTVAYKERVIKYYKEFKKQLANSDIDLNIAMTFSFGNENENMLEDSVVSPEIIEEMFADYGKFTGVEFNIKDKKKGEDAYFEDLIDRATRGGSGRNPKNIDLIIVADQLLTGYDSKRLNTLYVDRSLELQGLIQAYSRTNRVFGSSKEFGTIINFQYPRITEECVNKALELYGSGGESSHVIVKEYKEAVVDLNESFDVLVSTLKNPTNWKELETDSDEKKKFFSAFKEACKKLNLVEQYYEYSWDDEKFGINEHVWSQYVGAYKNLQEKSDKPDFTDIIPLVGKTRLVGTQNIDASYILKLIGSKVDVAEGTQNIDSETLRLIHEAIQQLSDLGDDKQAKLLARFVEEELMQGKVEAGISVDEAFEAWKKSFIAKDIISFAEEWGIDVKPLEKSLYAYSFVEEEVIPYNRDIIESVDIDKATKNVDSKLMLNMQLQQELPKWIREIKIKYKI